MPWLSREEAQIAHAVLELLAFFVGVRMFHARRTRSLSQGQALTVLAGAALGAAFGSKLVGLFQDPLLWAHTPLSTLLLTTGKSMVGGLLGAILGVEIAKKLGRVAGSTGDHFVAPLAVGLVIGRIGCFLAGRFDNTCGLPTAAHFGLDFGDGVPRHPTQLYEIAFVFLLALVATQTRIARLQPGDRFRIFAAGYFAFRLGIDTLKDYPRLVLGLSATQTAAFAGLIYYGATRCVPISRSSASPSLGTSS